MTLTARRFSDDSDGAPIPPNPEANIVKQVAALPYRFDDHGNVEVMLITSRGGQRWIPPKGNLVRGLDPHEAAAQEAYEEAGVIGRVSAKPIGTFHAVKAHPRGTDTPLEITLFPLRVDRRAEDWPERGQRTVLWFEPDGAAKVVKERDLAELLHNFHPAPGTGIQRTKVAVSALKL